MIRLRATRQEGLIPWAIRAHTLSDWDHIEIALNNGWFLGSHPNGGVQERHPHYIEPLDSLFLLIDAPAVDEWVLHNARSQIDKPYDHAAIFGASRRRDWHNPNAWICSELIAWSFEQAGVPILSPQVLGRISPRDILLSPYCRLAP